MNHSHLRGRQCEPRQHTSSLPSGAQVHQTTCKTSPCHIKVKCLSIQSQCMNYKRLRDKSTMCYSYILQLKPTSSVIPIIKELHVCFTKICRFHQIEPKYSTKASALSWLVMSLIITIINYQKTMPSKAVLVEKNLSHG